MVTRVGPNPPGLESLQEEEVRTGHTQRNDPVRTPEETDHCLHAQEGGLRRISPRWSGLRHTQRMMTL